MNIIELQDNLKNFSEDQLVNEMQTPSGMIPQFLVLSELNRRKRVKDDFAARSAENQNTVAQEAIAASGVPQEGLPEMAQSMAPKSASALSQPVERMAAGGLAMFGSNIANTLSNRQREEEINPFLDEITDLAESRFEIELPDTPMPIRPIQPPVQQPQPMPFPMTPPQVRPQPFPSPVIGPPIRFPQMPRPIGIGGKGRPRPPRMPGGVGRILGTARPYAEGGLLGAYNQDMDFSNMSEEEMIEFIQKMRGLSEPKKMRAGGKFVADGRILDAIEFIESGGDPEAINKRTGAAGAYQILDSTALNPGYGVKPISLEDRFDKKKARKFAKEYLEGIAKANPNFTTDQIVQAYHSGAKNVAEGNIGPEGVNYLAKFKDYGSMNQKPGGLESIFAKTGLISTAEAANEGETKKDDRSFFERLFNPRQDKDSMKMVKGSSLSEKEKKGKEDLKETIKGSDPLGFYDKDDKMGSSVPKPLTNYRDLLNLEAASRAEQGFIDPKEVFGGPQVYGEGPIVKKDGKEFVETKKDGKKILAELDKKGNIKVDKTGKDVTKDESGKGKVYDPPLPDVDSTSDLESDILKLQRQLEKDRDVDKWLSIAKAGLAIADPTKTLSEAAETGIDAMTEARKRYSDGVIDLINARAKLLKSGKTGLKLNELFTNLDRIEKAVLTFSEMGATPDPAKVKELNARKRQILQRISKFPGYESFKPIENPDQKVS